MTGYAMVFGPADVSHQMRDMRVLHERDPRVRERFDAVSRAAGLPVPVLLRQQRIPEGMSTVQVVCLGLLAGMLGVADGLEAERGRPACAGGVSVGELVALCLSGALSIDDAVAITRIRVDAPRSAAPDDAEAVGFVLVAVGEDWTFYERQPGMHVAVDYGLIQSGFGKLIMVSGLRRVLEGAGQDGPGTLEVLPAEMCRSAYHCDLRGWIRDAVAHHLATRPVGTPRFPVLTCLDDAVPATDPDAARQITVRSETERLRVPNMIEQMSALGVTEALLVGPFLRSLGLDFGVPVTCYDEEWINQTYLAPA